MAKVVVGKPIEITAAESRHLAELAAVMASLSKHQKTGWFLPYFQAHREILTIFQRIKARSHATGDTRRGADH